MSTQNDVSFLIRDKHGKLYFIPEDRLAEFEMPEDSHHYQDFMNDPATKMVQTALITEDVDGNCYPFGATCIFVPERLRSEMTKPQKLAYLNLDFDPEAAFKVSPHFSDSDE